MAHYKVNERYDQIVCPYDKLHVVDACRFQRHLLKCRKNHPTQDYRNCRFDHSHVYPAAEIRFHEDRCPAKVRAAVEIAGCTYNPPPAPANRVPVITSDENWDDEPPPVLQKVRRNQLSYENSRSHDADVADWLDATSNLDNNPYDDSTGDRGIRLPNNISKTMALAALSKANKKNPQNEYGKSLAMAGIGRGTARGSMLQAGIGRGRGRGRCLGSPDNLAAPPGRQNGASSDFDSTSDSSSASWSSMKAVASVREGPGQVEKMTVPDRAQADRLTEPQAPVVHPTEPVKNPPARSRIAAAFSSYAPAARQTQPVSTTQQTPDTPVLISNQEGSADVSNDPEARRKLIRKLTKKISEIKILQKQITAGKVLDEDQLKKISNYDTYVKELEDLKAEE